MGNEEALYNTSNYDEKNLKKLYRSYIGIYNLAISGNSTALAIFIDLKDSLYNAPITEKQRYYIIKNLIEGYTLSEIATDFNITVDGVIKSINNGLKKIEKYIND